MKLNITYDTELEILKITNDPMDPLFDTSLANSIRRSLYLTSHCYAINQILTSEQKQIFNKYFNMKLKQEERIYSVLLDNFYSLEFFAHRLNRIPLLLTKDTEHLFQNGIYLCLTDPEDFSKPFINKSSNPIEIYTSDLKFYTIDQIEDKIIELTPEEKNSLIAYDMPICTLLKDNLIHIMANPLYNCGYEGSEFEPCPIIYNFGLKETPKYKKKDMFDNPYQIYITVEFNGKKDLKMAYNDAINFLIYQLNIFKKEYELATMNGSDIIKIKNVNFDIQQIFIYNLDKKYYLADDTIGNLLSAHLLIYVNELYMEYINITEVNYDETIKLLLKNTFISYITADESLILRFIKLNFQISTNSDLLIFLLDKFKLESNSNNLLRIKFTILNNVCDRLISYYTNNLLL